VPNTREREAMSLKMAKDGIHGRSFSCISNIPTDKGGIFFMRELPHLLIISTL
jgi:hypothetical protein